MAERPSVFTESFLDQLAAGEPPDDTAEAVSEADFAGPWVVTPAAGGGWAVLAEGEPPILSVESRDAAQLAAAALPGLGRPPFFRIGESREAPGYPLLARDGRRIGHSEILHPPLALTMHALDCLRRDPLSLARFLCTARDAGLDRAGRLLWFMIQGDRS